MSIENKLAEVNNRLKTAKIRVQIQQRGDKLCLQATLPPRPSSAKTNAHQQRIHLDCYATIAGVQFAEAEAKKVGGLLDQHRFDWTPYLKTVEQEKSRLDTGELVRKFEQDKRSQGIGDRTWQGDYKEVLKRLPEGELSTEMVINLIQTTKPNSRTRRRYCMVMTALCRFAKLEIDLSSYIGNYSSSKVQPRDIPSDQVIMEWFDRIPNPEWQWCYGIMATYGIRLSELSCLEFDLMPVLIVRGRKNELSDRRVWALAAEWVTQFSLVVPKLPPVRDFGAQSSRQFKDRGIPFQPYDLRHAWAIRSLEFGLPIELAAQQMGHSLAVHSQTYHRWISDRTHAKAYEAIMRNRIIK